MTVEEWLTDLTLPYDDVPEGGEGPIDGARVHIWHGKGRAVIIDIHDTDNYRVNVTPYVTGAYKIVEKETGKIPMMLVSAGDSYGIEIVVTPHPDEVPAGAYYLQSR